MSDSWDFAADDEIGIPAGTRATVNAVPNRDGDWIRQGTTNKTGAQFLSIQFQVIGGDHAGQKCGLTLWPNPTDRRFRAQISTLLGIDISNGAKANMDDLLGALQQNSYDVEIGTNQSGYTDVTKLIERVDRQGGADVLIGEEPAAIASETSGSDAASGDEDFPF